MDFELSEDQQALGDAARDLLDDHASPAGCVPWWTAGRRTTRCCGRR